MLRISIRVTKVITDYWVSRIRDNVESIVNQYRLRSQNFQKNKCFTNFHGRIVPSWLVYDLLKGLTTWCRLLPKWTFCSIVNYFDGTEGTSSVHLPTITGSYRRNHCRRYRKFSIYLAHDSSVLIIRISAQISTTALLRTQLRPLVLRLTMTSIFRQVDYIATRNLEQGDRVEARVKSVQKYVKPLSCNYTHATNINKRIALYYSSNSEIK